MGCSSSANQTPQVSKMRRRLSVGDVTEDGTTRDENNTEAERGLITELNNRSVMEFIQQGEGGEGRKWSIGSQTDSDLNRRSSFANKTIQEFGDTPAKDSGMGYTCKKGLKPESPNQDSWFVVKVETQFAIYAVFDGHGAKGHDVSNFVKDHLPKLLIRDSEFLTDTKAVLTRSFRKVQSLIETATKTAKLNAQMSGTTCSVLVHRLTDNKLFVAYVGDSRCVLGKADEGRGYRAVDLTKDHKPDQKEEKKRIMASGGQVIYDGFANHRVYARGATYPGLNMSRALGDLMGHYDAGISAEPTVSEVQLGKGDDVILACSDGVWEFISSQESLNIIAKFGRDKALLAAEKLAKESWDRWIQEEGGMVVDDITALVIYLNN